MRVISKAQCEPIESDESSEKVYSLTSTMSEVYTSKLMSAAVVEIKPGKSSTPHYYKKTEESFFIIKGSGALEVNGRTMPVAEGQFFKISPNEIYQLNNTGDQALEFLAMCTPPWDQDDWHLA